MTHELALALPRQTLTSQIDVNAKVEELRPRCNLIAPMSAGGSLPPMQGVNFLDAGITPEDVYRDHLFCDQNERALLKSGILKIFRAAGVRIVYTQRVDDMIEADRHIYTAKIAIRRLDGVECEFVGTREVDLRDGSVQATKAKSANHLAMMRQHAGSMCETKAILKAARDALGLKHKYNVEELEKPFIVLCPVFDPSEYMDDPNVRMVAAQRAAGVQGALYGGAPAVERTAPQVIDTKPVEDGFHDDLPMDPPPPPPPPAEEPPAQEARAHVSNCPCGNQDELTDEEAAYSQNTLGEGVLRAPRSGCWPSVSTFDYEAHKTYKLGFTSERAKHLTPAYLKTCIDKERGAA